MILITTGRLHVTSSPVKGALSFIVMLTVTQRADVFAHYAKCDGFAPSLLVDPTLISLVDTL